MKYKLFTLEQLATIKYGKNQKKVQSDDGSIPIYGTGGLMGFATKPLYDKPSVLIGRKGTIRINASIFTKACNDKSLPQKSRL